MKLLQRPCEGESEILSRIFCIFCNLRITGTVFTWRYFVLVLTFTFHPYFSSYFLSFNFAATLAAVSTLTRFPILTFALPETTSSESWQEIRETTAHPADKWVNSKSDVDPVKGQGNFEENCGGS